MVNLFTPVCRSSALSDQPDAGIARCSASVKFMLSLYHFCCSGVKKDLGAYRVIGLPDNVRQIRHNLPQRGLADFDRLTLQDIREYCPPVDMSRSWP
jgi:hypothetical protein